MAWVEQALERGRRRNAEEQERLRQHTLARETEDLARQVAEQAASARIQQDRLEEVASLRRLLDERGARSLFEEVQVRLDGEITYQEHSRVDAWGTVWSAYGLVSSTIGPATKSQFPAENKLEELLDANQGVITWNDKVSPIHTLRIVLGTRRRFLEQKPGEEPRDPTVFYVHAGRGFFYRQDRDTFVFKRETPPLKRYSYNLSTFVSRTTMITSDVLTGRENNDPEALAQISHRGLGPDELRRIFLTDGRINPQSFNLGWSHGDIELNIARAPRDREGLRDFLARGLLRLG